MHGNAMVINYQQALYGFCFVKKCTILRCPTIKNLFIHRTVSGEVKVLLKIQWSPYGIL